MYEHESSILKRFNLTKLVILTKDTTKDITEEEFRKNLKNTIIRYNDSKNNNKISIESGYYNGWILVSGGCGWSSDKVYLEDFTEKISLEGNTKKIPLWTLAEFTDIDLWYYGAEGRYAKKNLILFVKDPYSNIIREDDYSDFIDTLTQNGISFSIITDKDTYSYYGSIATKTGGIYSNIDEDFSGDISKYISDCSKEVGEKCLVRLSNGTIVELDKDPSLGDESVDSDHDGIPDIIELLDRKTEKEYFPAEKRYYNIESWEFTSDPSIPDTDKDGIPDIDDIRPNAYDTVIKNSTDDYIEFNTGRKWNNISCTSFDYLDNLCQFVDGYVDNYIPIEEFRKICGNIQLNQKQEFNIEELTMIGLLNNEGSKIYLDEKTSEIREKIFKNLTNQESRYYQHSGLLWDEGWSEVAKDTKDGFFEGTVLSEADINFSLKLYKTFDMYSILNFLAKVGVIVISLVVVVNATPVVLANLQGLIYYVKTFGVFQGLKMYEYLGVSNLPNSVITWIQWDVADGDSSLDDIAASIQAKSVSDKLNNYLLNPEHEVGASKAKWFQSALGYNKNNMNDLAKQIVFDEKIAVKTAVTEYGTKYNQIISIVGANGKVIDVKFAWIKNLDGYVRLVTGIPTK